MTWQEFYYDHVVYREAGKNKLRGRYGLALAAVIYVGGTWAALHLDQTMQFLHRLF